MNVCIVCLESKDYEPFKIYKTSTEWQWNTIGKVIEKHLSWWNDADGEAEETKWLCRGCWEHLKTFNEFYNKVEKQHIQNFEILENCIIEEINGAELDEFVEQEDMTVEEMEIDEITFESLDMKPPTQFNDDTVENDNENAIETFSEYEDLLPLSEYGKKNDSLFLKKYFYKEQERQKQIKIIHENINDFGKSSRRKNQEFLKATSLSLKCELCSKKLNTFLKLKEHCRAEHNIAGYTYCCGKKFVESNKFADHLNVHANPDYFKCPECQRVLANRISFNYHMELHKPEDERRLPKSKITKKSLDKANNARAMDEQDDDDEGVDEDNDNDDDDEGVDEVDNEDAVAEVEAQDAVIEEQQQQQEDEQEFISKVEYEEVGDVDSYIEEVGHVEEVMNEATVYKEEDDDDQSNIVIELMNNEENFPNTSQHFVAEPENDNKNDLLIYPTDQPKYFYEEEIEKNSTPGKPAPRKETMLSSRKKNAELLKAANVQLECNICFEKLDSFLKLKTHSREVHNTQGYTYCCGKKFVEPNKFADHLNVHANPEYFKCPQCSKILANRICWKLHMRSHLPEEERPPPPPPKDDTETESDEDEVDQQQQQQVQQLADDSIVLANEPMLNDMENQLFGNEGDDKFCIVEKQPRTRYFYDAREKRKRSINRPAANAKKSKSARRKNQELLKSTNLELTCSICSVKLTTFLKLKAHFRDVHNEVGYTYCCGKKFVESNKFADHLNVHANPDYFKCPVCSRVLANRISFSYHIEIHKPPKERRLPQKRKIGKKFKGEESYLITRKKNEKALNSIKNDFICNICSETCLTFTALKDHFRDEHQLKGYSVCCNRKFYDAGKLIDHLNVHANPEYFKCPECGKVLSSRSSLAYHIDTHKPLEEKKFPFRCEECDKTFAVKRRYDFHLLNHTPDEEKQVECEQCGKRYVTKKHLQHHINVAHLNKYARICDICGKLLHNRASFDQHMEIHEKGEATKFPCDICGVKLKNKILLNRHKKFLHLEENLRPQKCSYCDKMVNSKWALKRHILYNHKSGPKHVCHLCSKSFKLPRQLKEHLAVHTGEPLYSCQYCDLKFTANANFCKHRKKAHPKQWLEDRLKKQPHLLMNEFDDEEEEDDDTINMDEKDIMVVEEEECGSNNNNHNNSNGNNTENEDDDDAISLEVVRYDVSKEMIEIIMN